MKSGYDVWNYACDGLKDMMELIQEKCPGGIYGFFGTTTASVLIWKYIVGHYLGMGRAKKRIQERQALLKNNINKIRYRVEQCREIIDISITDIPFLELQSKLQSGELTCRQVLLAYQAKALQVNDKTNCITGFIDEAEERAIKLDGLKEADRGPLHGIPLSFKETVGVAGQDCTSGLIFFSGKLHDDYGIMAKVLIKQGAVPFARTNISQGQLGASCSNPIFGESFNPNNTGRTCGGSSGGEGALLGGNGSILGVGCDMAGSIRIPAHFCGTTGFRPTGDRMSCAGNLPMNHGIVAIREVFGPMARDVPTLVAFFKSALDNEMFRLDPLIPQIPWREELFNKKPKKIGYYISDGGIEPVPAVRRAVLMAKTALEKMGYTVVEFNPPKAQEIILEFAVSTLMCDDGKMFGEVSKEDVIDPCVFFNANVAKVPHAVRWLLSKLLYFVHPVERAMLAVTYSNQVYDWWMRNEKREACRREFISTMRSQGIDALLGPVLPVAAWPLKDDAHSSGVLTYTMLYNALDFPAGAVPVTKVNTEDLRKMESYPNRYMTDTFIRRITQGSENLPVAVQCAGLPFQEESVLRIMTDLETGLRK